MLEKVIISDFFELGYVIIIIGDDVSLYFKSHLEVKKNILLMKLINACLFQTLKSE